MSIILDILGLLLIFMLLGQLWVIQSCRRQQKQVDLAEAGIHSGKEYEYAHAKFFQ